MPRYRYAWSPPHGVQITRQDSQWVRPPKAQKGQYGHGRERNYYGQAFSNGPKLEFPKFDGDNPEAWIRKVERCFELSRTPAEENVEVA